jgi:hypothetical protein
MAAKTVHFYPTAQADWNLFGSSTIIIDNHDTDPAATAATKIQSLVHGATICCHITHDKMAQEAATKIQSLFPGAEHVFQGHFHHP